MESASSFLHGCLVARSGFEPTSLGLHSQHSSSLPSSVSPCELFFGHRRKACLLPPQLSGASVCHTACLFLSVLCSRSSFPCVSSRISVLPPPLSGLSPPHARVCLRHGVCAQSPSVQHLLHPTGQVSPNRAWLCGN